MKKKTIVLDITIALCFIVVGALQLNDGKVQGSIIAFFTSLIWLIIAAKNYLTLKRSGR